MEIASLFRAPLWNPPAPSPRGSRTTGWGPCRSTSPIASAGRRWRRWWRGPTIGLPKALSGHQAYHDWGLRGFGGDVLIVLDDEKEVLERYFEEVELGGRVEHPYSMPYQHFDVWICRSPKVDFRAVWPSLRRQG